MSTNHEKRFADIQRQLRNARPAMHDELLRAYFERANSQRSRDNHRAAAAGQGSHFYDFLQIANTDLNISLEELRNNSVEELRDLLTQASDNMQVRMENLAERFPRGSDRSNIVESRSSTYTTPDVFIGSHHESILQEGVEIIRTLDISCPASVQRFVEWMKQDTNLTTDFNLIRLCSAASYAYQRCVEESLITLLQAVVDPDRYLYVVIAMSNCPNPCSVCGSTPSLLNYEHPKFAFAKGASCKKSCAAPTTFVFPFETRPGFCVRSPSPGGFGSGCCPASAEELRNSFIAVCMIARFCKRLGLKVILENVAGKATDALFAVFKEAEVTYQMCSDESLLHDVCGFVAIEFPDGFSGHRIASFKWKFKNRISIGEIFHAPKHGTVKEVTDRRVQNVLYLRQKEAWYETFCPGAFRKTVEDAVREYVVKHPQDHPLGGKRPHYSSIIIQAEVSFIGNDSRILILLLPERCSQKVFRKELNKILGFRCWSDPKIVLVNDKVQSDNTLWPLTGKECVVRIEN